MDLKEKQIIYVDNKPHIKCGVVMLETKDTTPLFLNTHQTKVGDMVLQHGKFHHLYITSGEEIKEVDWYINANNTIVQYKQSFRDKEILKKIIASTDTSLRLPQPSQQFIEKWIEEYNKCNIINEILVELKSSDLDYFYENIKVDSQNQITIRKQKDSWNRKEFAENIYQFAKFANNIFDSGKAISEYDIKKWIEENL